MRTVNIHDAKTNLSKLIETAVNGEPFIIAKAGRPMVVVMAVGPAAAQRPRIGFMRENFKIPADFDAFGREEIAALFAPE
jgi:prevent-host-death family protein